MSSYVIGDIALDNDVMDSMSCECSIVRVVYGAVANVRPIHAPTQVEMDCIATKTERLSHVTKLSVLNPENTENKLAVASHDGHMIVT